MAEETTFARLGRYAMAIVAVGFGLLTLWSGGTVLFGSDQARRAAGDYVPFVLWFNFTAGFAYLAGGIGLALRRPWSRWVALSLALASAVVYLAFGGHILLGGRYEIRTVVAMALRTGIWAVIAAVAFRIFE